MNIALCDDEWIYTNTLLTILHEIDSKLEVTAFQSGQSLLEIAAQRAFDLVFLDVYLDKTNENGLEIAKELKNKKSCTEICFLTVSKEHAIEAFSLKALHYLLKPFQKEEIKEVIERYLEKHPAKPQSLTLPNQGKEIMVPLDHIVSLCTHKHAVEVKLVNQQMIRVWKPMKQIQQGLDNRFLKVNRGIIVNMDHIYRMKSGSCILKDKSEYYFSVRDKNSILASYQDYILDNCLDFF